MRASSQVLRIRHDELVAAFADHDPLFIRYAPDELIFQVGSYAAGVYLVSSGIVQESYNDPANADTSAVTGLLGAPSLIGLGALFCDSDQLHCVSCRALSDISLVFLEQSAFEDVVETHETVRRFVLHHLADRYLRLSRAMWRSRLEPEGRLRALLNDLLPFGDAADDGAVVLPTEIDRRRIASLCDVPLRKIRELAASIDGASWDGKHWRISADSVLPR